MLVRVDVVAVLAELGGVATFARLRAVVGRERIEAAVADGRVRRLARGRLALPAAEEARTCAHALTGVLSFRHAAVHHGWAVKRLPRLPDVTVARNRRLTSRQLSSATVHRAALGPDDVREEGGGRMTSPDRTLTDCLRGLPYDEALAVADSALRAGVTQSRLLRLTSGLTGPGAPQAKAVAAAATELAANPFESVLRAIALEVTGLRVTPQVELWNGAVFLGRSDLVDRDLRIVLEADSFTWHGDRAALAHDCRRYDEMVAAGWLVLRFAYEHVMSEPAWVRSVLVATAHERTVHPRKVP